MRYLNKKGNVLVILLCCCVVWLGADCAGWKPTALKSLSVIQQVGVTAHGMALKVCRPALEKCIKEKTNPCPKLLSCQKTRRPVLQSLDTLQRTVLLGLIAVEVGDKKSALDAIVRAQDAIELARAGLKTWGVKLP